MPKWNDADEVVRFRALMDSLKQSQRERELMFEMLDREITRIAEAEQWTDADIDFLARAKRVLEGRF